MGSMRIKNRSMFRGSGAFFACFAEPPKCFGGAVLNGSKRFYQREPFRTIAETLPKHRNAISETPETVRTISKYKKASTVRGFFDPKFHISVGGHFYKTLTVSHG